MGHRTLAHAVDIPASPAAVWQVLAQTDRYPEWNPFMTVSGRLAAGERLTVTIRPGRRTMTFRPTVLAVEDGALIRWRGTAGVRGIFDGEHELRVEPGADGGTRFVQQEVFSGLLVPVLRRVLDDTEAGFAAMNAALRDRAVAHAHGPAQP
ncbi:SRPBCC domain-containing protein [Geodermatophilus marinus]|uniref:SRPBCC domain-containing protein n=1 Tax=Geodermatophilus sp. LHW52908 TaxID=2303986 RepID=UPI000E3E64E9|nr:SRPBCC domain-containing protein [Geodermatophilus sp. LHW52908]RFU20073.1 SRPBCC domain-containing protein [Geodermatophilus sp. LHW52908]